VSTLTTNFSLIKPDVNNPDDQDIWGNELNTDLDTIDGLLNKAINVVQTTLTGNTTLDATYQGKLILCDATSAAFTITLLPSATAGSGFKLAFKKIDSTANAVTIDGNASETIDGASTISLASQYQDASITADGTNWQIISEYGAASNTIGANTVVANPSSSSAAPGTVALSASNLLGRGSSGNVTAITIGAGLSFTGSVLNTASSGGSSMVLLATQSGAAASYNFTAAPAAGYSEFVVVFAETVFSSGTADLLCQVSTNAGSSYVTASSNYVSTSMSLTAGTSTSETFVTGATSSMRVTSGSIGSIGGGELKISPGGAYSPIFTFNGGFATTFCRSVGYPSGIVGTVNAFRLIPTTGTITSGAAYLYGIKTS